MNDYQIDENQNYTPGHGNLFLMYMGRCVGGADLNLFTGKWIVSIDKPLDVETDSDSAIIGECDDQAAARQILWEARYQAEVGA